MTTKKEVHKEMNQLFGFVPSFYQALPDTALASAWGLQRDIELAETKLDGKTKELIGLSMASHLKCKYCIYFHTRAADLNGATPQEMREAILMGGLTVLYSNSISGVRTDYDAFARDVDRAIEHLSASMR